MKVGNAAQLTDLAFSEFSSFAREHGLGFIVDDNPPAKNPARFCVRLRTEHEVAFPIAQTYLAAVGLGESFRGFGINE